MKTNARIYVMRAEDGSLKLGHSKNPEERAKWIGRPVEIVHQTDVIEQVERIERLAHRVLALHGKHIRGEWFEAKLEDALLAIEIATRQAENAELALGGSVAWNRPPSPYTGTMAVHLGSDGFRMLDELRRHERPIPSRPQMIRKLVWDAYRKAVKDGKLVAR